MSDGSENILGVDPGAKKFGMVVINGRTMEVVYSQTHSFGTLEWTHWGRRIEAKLEEVFAVHPWSMAGMEAPQLISAYKARNKVSANARTANTAGLFGVSAVLAHWLQKRDIELKHFHPTTLKSFGTGDSKATKSEMMKAAKERSGHKFSSDHCADGFWAAAMAADLFLQSKS